ncbi:hypothetical protein AMTRI_Chr02g260430 [Amborella trichopoda]
MKILCLHARAYVGTQVVVPLIIYRTLKDFGEIVKLVSLQMIYLRNQSAASQEYLTIKPKPMIIQDRKNILERNDGRVDLSSLDIWVLERDQMIYLRNQSAASQEHLTITPEPMIIQDRKNIQERDDGRVELSYLDIWVLEKEKRCRKVSTIWAFEREMGERYRL